MNRERYSCNSYCPKSLFYRVFFSFSYWTSAVGAYTKSHAYDSPLLLYRDTERGCCAAEDAAEDGRAM